MFPNEMLKSELSADESNMELYLIISRTTKEREKLIQDENKR